MRDLLSDETLQSLVDHAKTRRAVDGSPLEYSRPFNLICHLAETMTQIAPTLSEYVIS